MTTRIKDGEAATHEERYAIFRALLQEPPSEVIWRELTQLLEQWDDPQLLREVVVPYATTHLSVWPEDAIRETPQRWLRNIIAIQKGELEDDGLFSLGRELVCYEESNKEEELAIINTPSFEVYTHLHIHLANFTYEDLQAITSAPTATQLKGLSIIWSQLTDQMLALLKTAPWRLTALSLHGNDRLSDSAVADLLRHPSMKGLRKLDLGYIDGIGEQSIKAIAASKLRLESLILDSCKGIGHQELKQLTHSEAFKSLAHLDLKSTEINAYGEHPKQLGALLSSSPHVPPLKSLNLSFCNLDDEDAVALASWRGLEQLEELDLNYHYMKRQGFDALAHSPYLRQLKKLDFSNAVEGVNSSFQVLFQAPWLGSVEELRFWSCDLTARQTRQLANNEQLQHLRKLNLWSNPLGVTGLKALMSSPIFAQLQVLELPDCLLRDGGLTALAQIDAPHQLEELGLDQNNATAKGVLALLASAQYPHLTKLHISQNNLKDLAASGPLPQTMLRQLDTLFISETLLTLEALEALFQALGDTSRLTHLDLSHNRVLGDKGLALLLQAPFIEQLEQLTLDDCNIDDQGGELLLKAAPRLRRAFVSLERNPLQDAALLQKLQASLDLFI